MVCSQKKVVLLLKTLMFQSATIYGKPQMTERQWEKDLSGTIQGFKRIQLVPLCVLAAAQAVWSRATSQVWLESLQLSGENKFASSLLAQPR